MLDGVDTFEEFHKRMQKLPKEVYKNQPVYEETWIPEKIIGDSFEWFGEAFIKILGNDSRIGITDYRPIPPSDDEGCDGVGIGMNLLPAGVQFKEKGNPTHFVKNNDDHLGNFTDDAAGTYGVNLMTTTPNDSNLTLITSGAGLHPYSATHGPGKRCRVINYTHLVMMLYKHQIFWNEFKKLAYS